MKPSEYIEKVTDYSEDGKSLNLLFAYYSPKCSVNIVTKIGFGNGAVKRRHHPGLYHLNGAPYLLRIGSLWSEQIPYDTPEEFLTFRWFKHNVMCLDQPWICH